MNTTDPQNSAEYKRAFSKIDSAGTDPNRYASISNPEEEEHFRKTHDKKKSKSIIPGLEVNVGKVERIMMIAAGSYLLYKALTAKKKSTPKTITAGTMLFRGVSGYCPLYDAVAKSGKLKASNVNIRTSVQINRPVKEVYDFWRKLENLPQFMSHLKKVDELDNVTSEWTANGPAGIGQISWRAQILMDEPGKMLSWCSLPGSTVDNAGKVVFKDTGFNQTELDVTVSYHAPLGVAGEAAAKLLNPLFESMVKKDIESLKTILESNAPAIA